MEMTRWVPRIAVYDREADPGQAEPGKDPSHGVMSIVFIQIRRVGIIHYSEEKTQAVQDKKDNLQQERVPGPRNAEHDDCDGSGLSLAAIRAALTNGKSDRPCEHHGYNMSINPEHMVRMAEIISFIE